MKKYLLLFIMLMCCFSIFASEWNQCKNCGERFKGGFSIGYDYCRRNSCQKVRKKEESQKASATISADLKYLQGMTDKRKLIKLLGEYLAKAQKTKTPVKTQIATISAVYKKLVYSPYTWEQVIRYASMDVIKACWPSADNESVHKKSSAIEANPRAFVLNMMYSFDSVPEIGEPSLFIVSKLELQQPEGRYSSHLHKQSNKKIGCAFALGRHQKTGKIRYVETLNANSLQYLVWAADAGRTDVLEWFFKQMGGTDNTVLCLFNSFFANTLKNYDLLKKHWKEEIAKLEKQKSNAADKYQEKEFSKKIAGIKAQIAEIPTKPIDKYDDVKKTISKYTDDKVFNEFTALVDKFLVENKKIKGFNQYKITVVDFIKSDSKRKQAGEIFATLGVFTWKANLPNLKKVGVVAGKKFNTWVAAPGFVMQKDGSAKWQAGLKHPKYPGVVSTEQIFCWMPDAKHLWKNSESKDLSAIADYKTLPSGVKKAAKISAGVAVSALR